MSLPLSVSTPAAERYAYPPALARRALDLACAGVGLALLAIMVVPVAVAIRLDSPGPIFYTQRRVGLGGRRFRMVKFRSMVADAERHGPIWAQPDDPRVTRVGRLLRRTHIDELPQAWNLLRGDMSVVGPRPERPELVATLTALDPRHADRLAVRPGLAGLGYLRQGYVGSTEEALERLRHDLEYLERRSLRYDVWLLLASLRKAIRYGGR